jgi:hypothetical protein
MRTARRLGARASPTDSITTSFEYFQTSDASSLSRSFRRLSIPAPQQNRIKTYFPRFRLNRKFKKSPVTRL